MEKGNRILLLGSWQASWQALCGFQLLDGQRAFASQGQGQRVFPRWAPWWLLVSRRLCEVDAGTASLVRTADAAAVCKKPVGEHSVGGACQLLAWQGLHLSPAPSLTCLSEETMLDSLVPMHMMGDQKAHEQCRQKRFG